MNENDKRKINSAFENIDDKLIEEAAAPIKGRGRMVIKRAFAACAALMVAAAIPFALFIGQNPSRPPTPEVPESSETFAPLTTPSPNTDKHPESTPPEAPSTELPEITIPWESADPEVPSSEAPASTPPASTLSPPVLRIIDTYITVGGSTLGLDHRVESIKATHKPTGKMAEYTRDYGIEEVLLDMYFSINVMTHFPGNDISLELDGGRVIGYTLYKMDATAPEDPVFTKIDTEITDLSQVAEHPGFCFLVIDIEYAYDESEWEITGAIVNAVAALNVFEPVESAPDSDPTRPGGSLSNGFVISVGETEYEPKAYMRDTTQYGDKIGQWLNGCGEGAYGGIARSPLGIPELVYSPDMSFRTADNTRLVSIGLWDTNDLDKQISINKSAELHDHPGTWYLVLTAHHQGRYIDDPLFPGHENSTYDYVIKVTVPKLTEENIQLSNGSQTLNTKGFLVSSRIYNVKSDSFDEVNGEGVGGRLPEVAPTLGVFCVTRGMEMGYSLASNAEVVAIRVYDSSFGELPVSSELGNVVPAITGLPAGEYYVVLEIVYTGLYYKSHDATETVRIDEAFKLIVVDEIMSDSLNFPVHEWTESTADGKTTFKCTGCDKSITIASEIPNFSYAKVLEYHRIGDPGVKHEDFPYQYVNEISSVILAITCAERQVTIEYDTISVAFDKDASIWCVAFYNADLDGGDQSVYLDSMGLTRYIVYGE